MNSKQKLHQIKLTQWASRFQEQAASGLTVKAWCAENNVTIHTYNYWKHLLKQDAVDQLLPDIVPLSFPTVSEVESQTPSSVNSKRSIRSTARLTLGDIFIEVDDYASEAFLSALIKAVRHA